MELPELLSSPSMWSPGFPAIRAAQLAESAAILQTAGVGVLVWSFDCEAYYRKVGRQRGEIWRNCYVVGDGYVVDEREQFGDASAAVKCCRMLNYLAWLVRRAMRAVDDVGAERGNLPCCRKSRRSCRFTKYEEITNSSFSA